VAKAARRAGPRIADGLARLDLRFKFTGRGLPKNYQVVATK
jgi:hypothetical protein